MFDYRITRVAVADKFDYVYSFPVALFAAIMVLIREYQWMPREDCIMRVRDILNCRYSEVETIHDLLSTSRGIKYRGVKALILVHTDNREFTYSVDDLTATSYLLKEFELADKKITLIKSVRSTRSLGLLEAKLLAEFVLTIEKFSH